MYGLESLVSELTSFAAVLDGPLFPILCNLSDLVRNWIADHDPREQKGDPTRP